MDASILARARARAGDADALELLVQAYHDRVLRFGRRVCSNTFDAEDAVQEAFIKLAHRPDVVRDAGALSWLMTVVRNACARMLRPFARSGRRVLGETAELEQVASDAATPEAALARWQLVRSVHTAIAALDPLYREVIILRDLEVLSGAEVSRILGISEATMKTRLHRARQMLRQRILLASSRQE